MAGIDYGVLDTVGIVASRRLAEVVMDNIVEKRGCEVEKYYKSRYRLELYFYSGTRFMVCPLSDASRGLRLTYAIIDKNIHDAEFLNNIVYPMCACCKQEEMFHISDSEEATNVALTIIDLIRESKYTIE